MPRKKRLHRQNGENSKLAVEAKRFKRLLNQENKDNTANNGCEHHYVSNMCSSSISLTEELDNSTDRKTLGLNLNGLDYIKEESLDIEIKDEPCFDNETQWNCKENDIQTLDDNTKTFQCTDCDVIYNSADKIEHYKKSHGIIIAEYLAIKSEKIRPQISKNNLPIFVKQKGEPGELIKCIYIGCKFASKCSQELKSHLKKHKQRPYRCKHFGCYFTARNRSDLDNHAKQIHNECNITDLKPFYCDECKFSCASADTIENHRKFHVNLLTIRRDMQNNTVPIFVKRNDEDPSENMKKIIRRNKISDSDDKQDLISLDGSDEDEIDGEDEIDSAVHEMSKEENRDALQLQQRVKKPFKCKHIGCNYASRREHNHARHMKKHIDKRLRCKHNGCIFSSRSLSWLESHMNKMHNGTQYASIIHTDEKTFACSDCEYRSMEKNSLNMHIRKYHREQMIDNVVNHEDLVAQEDVVSHLRYQESKRESNSKDFLEKYVLYIENHVESNGNMNIENEQFECSQCDYICSSEKNIQEHSLICKDISGL